MEKAGAKFIARGVPFAVKEDGEAVRTIVIEWESMEAAENGEEERALFASEYSFEKEINQIKNYAENAFEMLISYSNDEQHKSAMKLLAGSNVRFCHVDNIQ